MYLLESEMRSLELNWTFPIYSAYDDSAYNEHMLIIDGNRLKVYLCNISSFFNPTLCRMGMYTSAGSFVSYMAVFLRVMIWFMHLMVGFKRSIL